MRKIFRRIPALIGNKLKYVRLDPEERSRELADSLHLLEMARVIYRVRHSAGNGVPLGAEAKERDFKPLFLDTGLVSTSLGLSLPGLEMVDDLLMVNNGALAEQFVGQHLLDDRPSYEKPQLFLLLFYLVYFLKLFSLFPGLCPEQLRQCPHQEALPAEPNSGLLTSFEDTSLKALITITL